MKRNEKSLVVELRKLGVQGDLEPAVRDVGGVLWDVLIGCHNNIILVFALVASAKKIDGYVARVVRCPKCSKLVFSEPIENKKDLSMQAEQQAGRSSVPSKSHEC